jgi:hypothetical protein
MQDEHEYRPRADAPDILLHARKCSICHHPRRFEIEEAFIHWDHPTEIVRRFGISNRSVLYRHARAGHLYKARSLYIRSALDHIIERAAVAPITANAVVNAVRVYTHINEQGKWVEPPRKIIFAKDEPPTQNVEIVVSPDFYEAHLARQAAEKAAMAKAAAEKEGSSLARTPRG